MNEHLLIQFLTHQCTPAELREIEEWMSADEANRNWLFEMEDLWSLKDVLRFSEKKKIDSAYTRFIDGIQDKKSITSKHKYSFVWIKYVAAALLIGLLCTNLYLMLEKDKGVMNVIEVPRGQKASLLMSDGTKVWLNSQSKLTYPPHFSTGERTVKLEGEGYFEVAQNKKVPFIISSDLLKIKVLGTRFNAKMYSEEAASVALEEGSVEVQTQNLKHKFIMNPNEQITYSEDKGLTINKSVNASMFRSWITGETAYLNETLENITRDLERKFNVHITITDADLSAEVFTCHFKDIRTVEQVLDLLKATRKLDFKIKNNEIQIYKPIK